MVCRQWLGLLGMELNLMAAGLAKQVLTGAARRGKLV